MRKTIIMALFYGLITNIYSATITSTLKLSEQESKYIIEKLYQKSMLLKNFKKYNKAIASLKKIINIDQNQVDAHLLLSELEYLNKNWKKAIIKSKDYLKIINFKDKKNFLDISWAYFLIGEVENSMDYIIKFFQSGKELFRENIFIAIDALFKKSIYHFINNENAAFNTILSSTFQLALNDDTLFIIFLNNLEIIKQIPFYYFNRKKLEELYIQINTLKTIQNTTCRT
ncbi:tetratricopeptide repeat protein [Borreliella carolinensis]|uniref:Tetratricopeptide repeat protein n=1 Tax=Borreliella carolinensis TaxID=478174 RepID=A0ABY9E5J3_9SPIR|nr:tetratricopeptide repeat protein [Borreliella carolinensis]WKC90707.1 tetratricopeptide repeat protein [Borreliella carolinensis]WNY67641.1 tetratricopeptide repeat protein [Borreliella carolinensis]